MGVDASGKDDGDGTGIFFFVAMYNLQNFPDFVIVAAPCCFFHGFGGVAQMAAGRGTFDDNKVRDAVIVIIPKLQKNFGSPGRGNDRGELDGASRCVFWQISRETSSGNDEIGSVFDTAADVFLVVGQGAHDVAAQQAAVTRNETARTEAEKARTDAEAELAQYTAELAALGESTGSLTAEREKITGELSEKQLQRLADEKDVGLHEAALEGLRSRTGEADARARELQTAIEAAKAKIEANALKIAEMERVRGDNQQKIAAAEETIRSANAARLEKEAAISKLGQDNRALTDERERMSGEMARLAERRTAAETELNDTNSKLWEEYQLTEGEARSHCVPFESLTELRRSVTEVRGKIRALGNVNVGAIDEYKEVRERYDFMKAQVTDVEKAKAELTKMIAELCSEMQELFTASFKQINANFQQIFKELFGGGHARLYLSDEANVLESGIEIEVSPPGKVIKNLSALSGGEQALVAISIYFAILNVNPAPFCFLDEIEAALDDVNVARYAQYLRRMTDNTQFIVITHRRGTMEAADVLYGVTMQEDGVSKILRLDLDNVSADLIT